MIELYLLFLCTQISIQWPPRAAAFSLLNNTIVWICWSDRAWSRMLLVFIVTAPSIHLLLKFLWFFYSFFVLCTDHTFQASDYYLTLFSLSITIKPWHGVYSQSKSHFHFSYVWWLTVLVFVLDSVWALVLFISDGGRHWTTCSSLSWSFTSHRQKRPNTC